MRFNEINLRNAIIHCIENNDASTATNRIINFISDEKGIADQANELTEQDLNDLQYFWQEKGDLERLCNFERLVPILQKKKPEVLKAWNNYKASKKMLDIVMDSL